MKRSNQCTKHKPPTKMYECKLLEAMARHFNNPLQKDYAHVSNWEEENIFNTSFVQNRLDVNHPTVFYHIGEGGSFSHICILYRGSWQIRYRAFEKYKTAGWDKYSQNGAVPGWRRMLLWIRLQISDWTFRFKMWEPTSTKNWHTHIDLPYYPSNSQLTNLFWIFYNISLNIVIHISIFSINKSPQKKEPDGPDAKVTPCKRHRQDPHMVMNLPGKMFHPSPQAKMFLTVILLPSTFFWSCLWRLHGVTLASGPSGSFFCGLLFMLKTEIYYNVW